MLTQGNFDVLPVGDGAKRAQTVQPTVKLRIETIGVPRISDENGRNLTPVGSRNRVIPVILALSPRMTVGRRWLEALLWSDRGPDQASGSLRQALSSIRRQLGDARDILCANRTDIWMTSKDVTIDLLDDQQGVLQRLRAGRDFLEGIDILSEGFEDWLRQERASLLQMAEVELPARALPARLHATEAERPLSWTQEPPRFFLDQDLGLESDKLERFLTDAISTQLTHTVKSHFRADVRALDGTLTPVIVTPGARFAIRVTRINKAFAVLARMTEEPAGRLFWSRQLFIDSRETESMMDTAAALATEASEAMGARSFVASPAQQANVLAAEALADVFSFDPDRLRKAIRTLGRANDIDPHAPRPALKALALAFLALETRNTDRDHLIGEVTDLIRQSRALDSRNALALSFLADVQDLVFEDPQTALSYAKSALRSNPGIGYAYASLGALELRRGAAEAALIAASRAQRQLANSSLEVFSLMRLCVANLTAKDFDAAEQAAQRAAELAPTSQPPLRHLYALRLRRKDYAAARQTLRALRRLDPLFSMQYLRENPEFPAATIRTMQLHKLMDVELG